MATYISFIYLFAALTILTVSYGNITLPTITTPPAVSPMRDNGTTDEDEQKFFNIMEALLESGEMENWGYMLNKINTSLFPSSVTLFIPQQNHVTLNSSDYYYHIVPQRLTFSDLSLLPIGSRIPTLLPNNSILVTNNSLSNFCIDGVHLNRPDLYSTENVTLHGISRILNYSVNGNEQMTGQATRLKIG